jgi:hypothetical protein
MVRQIVLLELENLKRPFAAKDLRVFRIGPVNGEKIKTLI